MEKTKAAIEIEDEIFKSEGSITKTCKECKNSFTYTTSEAEWLREKGLEPYKRCPDCRKARKEKRKAEYEDNSK